MIILIDNYDSFTFNLYQYLSEFSEVIVCRNNEITIEKLMNLKPKGIVVSPGPGRPENAGISVDLIRELGNKIPILGVCLGHQAIGLAFGGNIKEAKNIMHGKKSNIRVKKDILFSGIKRKFEVMRYHSLIIEKETLPKEIEVIASSLEDEEIMAIKHKEFNIYGLQFHPESIYTEEGKTIVRNFVMEVCRIYDK